MNGKVIKDVVACVVYHNLFGPVWRVNRLDLFRALKQLKTHANLTEELFDKTMEDAYGKLINGFWFYKDDDNLIIA